MDIGILLQHGVVVEFPDMIHAVIDGETVIIQNDAGSGVDVTIDRLNCNI